MVHRYTLISREHNAYTRSMAKWQASELVRGKNSFLVKYNLN